MGSGDDMTISGSEGVRMLIFTIRDNIHSEISPKHDRDSIKSLVGVR